MDVGDNLSVLARQEAIKEHDDDARTRLKARSLKRERGEGRK